MRAVDLKAASVGDQGHTAQAAGRASWGRWVSRKVRRAQGGCHQAGRTPSNDDHVVETLAFSSAHPFLRAQTSFVLRPG